MKRINGRLLAPIMIPFLLVGILYGCANRVAPDGGPYDVTPPKLVSSSPEDRALNVSKKRFVLTFDEYIQIQDIANKVIISPPQITQPKIVAVGKKVTVELEDDLIPNTTYSIDFTDAIVDNNEGNPLENFSYAFSTGNEIDTMEISGRVINIRNHEPMQSLLVGVHPESAGWNAFTDTTFSRMSRTGDRAQFVMRNMKQGSYRVYALKESDGNYRHDMPTDGVAFLNELITTSAMAATRQDTTWVDSLTIDTIKTVAYTRYLPDDIVLLYYETEAKRRFISKRERPDSMQLRLVFSAIPEGKIKVRPIDSLAVQGGSTPVLDINREKKEVMVYFTDPTWKRYKEFEVSYTSVDSLELPIMVHDSLTLRPSAPKPIEDKGRLKETNDSIAKPKSPLTLRFEHKGEGGTSDSLLFYSSLPITPEAFKAFELFNAQDSILKPVTIDSIYLLPGRTTVGMIEAKLSYDTSYELYADSAKFTDVYGHMLDETVVDAFKTKAKDAFSQLSITVDGVEGPFIGELLSTQDAVLRVVYSDKPTLHFKDIKPEKYGFRLIVDSNNNGKWDAGNYRDSIQPEMVYYMPKIIEVMANWDVKETLSPLATKIDKQKPEELIKNKPKAKEKKDRNKEREEQLRRQRQGNNQGMGGLGDMGGMGGLGGLGGMNDMMGGGRM